MLHFSHKNASSPRHPPPPKKPTSSPGRFSLALGVQRQTSKAKEKRPGDEAEVLGGRGRNRPATLATQTPEITFPDKVSNSFEHRILTSPDRTFPSGRGEQCSRSSCQKIAPRDGGPVC